MGSQSVLRDGLSRTGPVHHDEWTRVQSSVARRRDIEYNVMDLLVGNRQAPEATILGGVHHFCVRPTRSEGRDGLGSSVVSPCYAASGGKKYRMAYVSLASTAGERLRDQRFLRTGVRLRYQRLQTLRRPCYRLLRHRSVKVVGTCCTRPWCQGACVRSE